MVSCILLSAGESLRFGSPKAIAKINAKTVIEHVLDTLVASPLEEIVVVLGAHQDDIKPYLFKHKKVKSVYNKDYNLGQTSSFKAGLCAVSKKTKGMLLLPVDYPLVTSKTITTVVHNFLEKIPLIQLPMYDQKRGHPPIFNVRLR